MLEATATVLMAMLLWMEDGWCKDLSITLGALGAASFWGYYKLLKGRYVGWVTVQCLLGLRILGVLFLAAGLAVVGDRDLPVILGVIFALIAFWLLFWNYLYTPQIKACCCERRRREVSSAHMNRRRIAAIAILITLCIGVAVWSRLLILSLGTLELPTNSANTLARQVPATQPANRADPGPTPDVASHTPQ